MAGGGLGLAAVFGAAVGAAFRAGMGRAFGLHRAGPFGLPATGAGLRGAGLGGIIVAPQGFGRVKPVIRRVTGPGAVLQGRAVTRWGDAARAFSSALCPAMPGTGAEAGIFVSPTARTVAKQAGSAGFAGVPACWTMRTPCQLCQLRESATLAESRDCRPCRAGSSLCASTAREPA